MLGCAASAPSAPSAPPEPRSLKVTLTPGQAHYSIRSNLDVEQDVGGQIQESDLRLLYYLTAELAPAAAGLSATLVLDSVGRYDGTAAVATDFRQARGVTFKGHLQPNGELAGFQGGDTTIRFIRELREDIRGFFPRLPTPGAEPGARWVDTTERRSTSSGVPLFIWSVANHHVEAVGEHRGEPTLPIRTQTSYHFEGTGVQGGQAFRVDGSGERHETELISITGRYLGLVSTDSSSFMITLAGTGLQIPGRQVRADTVSIVP